MGNCLTLYNSHCKSCAAGEQRKAVVQVVKMDGKILEFAASILVKDLLVNYPGWGVGPSTRTPRCLPSGYELKVGNIYFLFPLLTRPATAHHDQAPEEVSAVVHREEPAVIKTIKVVITKKQLQNLVSDKISVDAVVSEIKSAATCSADYDFPRAKDWKPELESIPEGDELGFSHNKKGSSLLLSI